MGSILSQTQNSDGLSRGYVIGNGMSNVVLKNTVCTSELARSRPFTADAARKLDILRHDGHSLGVDCAQIGV